MKRRYPGPLASLLVVCALLAPALGRTPAPQTPVAPQTGADEDVVRITANLVQFDAVVYDKDNRPVTDLGPEDFEVTVGGERQEITNFSYVSTAAGTATSRPVTAAGPGAPPLPPVRLRPEQVRRTVALVVDDLGTSFESMAYVRQTLKKFVDEQVQPGDLVAILRTSAGVGALQQFTSDKRILYKAIERVRWYPTGRAGISAFAPIEADPARAAATTAAGSVRDTEGTRGRLGGVEEFREEIFSVGTLGALNFIVRGMGELPGRKSVVMFSDGFEIYQQGNSLQTDRVLTALRRLADLANRAAVAVYTIDARGLPTLGLTAADSTSGFDRQGLEQQLSDRRSGYLNTQDGLRYLAEETGGTFSGGSNDLARGIRRALEDQQGYYLVGFRPDSEVFDAEKGRARYNRFQIKLRRPGLKVRARGGFYGVTDAEARPVRRTRAEQMMAALTSPFASGELGLRLTSLFSSAGKQDSILESMLHMDVSRFTVADDAAGGWKKLVFDLVAVTFGDSGQVLDEVNRTETIRMRGEALKYVVENGLVYKLQVPLKKPGAYQLRVAVRDTATERVGSASQFVEVPDLRKNRLALSSILLTTSAPAPPAADAPHDPLRDAAVRSFRQGGQVDFVYHIYNAKLDKTRGRPQLRTQVRLFREGRPVFEGRPNPFDAAGQPEVTRLQAGSRLTLGRDLAPGEYALQVVVTDALADAKHAVATQWIDFEIVK